MRRGARTVLDHLYQKGSAKARFPKVFDGGPPEAVLINLAGGITGADCFHQTMRFGDGTRAVATTQAAEKIYKASTGAAPAKVSNTLTVDANAFAEWLPQETIFFDGGRLSRRFKAILHPTARLLACEAIVFGRTAMGEIVHRGFFHDDWRIVAGERVIYADGLRFDGAIQSRLDSRTIADGGRALATVLYVGPDSEGLIDMAKQTVEPFQTRAALAAASRIGDVIVARFIAADGQALRAMLDAYVSTMRQIGGQAAGELTLQPAAGSAPKLWRC